ncbi:MAG: diheme cytochrome c-553 [Chitinophagales bacterium]|nr:diheme cytochrome c-553 [Chitinophagales bacterium]
MKQIIVSALIISIIILACNQSANHTNTLATVVTNDSLIKKGEYLVSIIGCGDCHSPEQFGPDGPEPIKGLEPSGFQYSSKTGFVDTAVFKNSWILMTSNATAAAGPWGISFAGNITSDETGIGNWTEQQFKKALTQGKFKGLDAAGNLLPPIPRPIYRNMKDEDISAIYACLKSTKPVKNIIPAQVPSQKFNTEK